MSKARATLSRVVRWLRVSESVFGLTLDEPRLSERDNTPSQQLKDIHRLGPQIGWHNSMLSRPLHHSRYVDNTTWLRPCIGFFVKSLRVRSLFGFTSERP